MKMKGQILKALRGSEGDLPGETLAARLGISEASVRKHIRSLENRGYVIEDSPAGYRLVSSPDLLLPCEFPGLEHRIHYFPEVGSTMDPARELARGGAEEGTIVIAEAQTQGRGRLSRQWLSPRGGIYFTIILRPEISPAYAPRMNLMASVAVANTVRRLYGLKAEVKWPNDVLIAGKKICGILAEMDAEMDVVKFVNLGIGINANTSIDVFEERATSLKDALGSDISRKELLSALLAEIEQREASLMETNMLEEWRNLSVTLGKHVRIQGPGEVMTGEAIDIDSTGALIIRESDGSLKRAVVGDCIQ